MSFDDLVSEAERLAKPSLVLSPEPNDKPIVAYWGGSKRKVCAGREDDRHKITFDCAWLRSIGIDIAGSIELYDVNPRWGWVKPFYIHHESQSQFNVADFSGGQSLYGYERTSLPPLPALCLYGGQRVTEWLNKNGWKRTDYDLAEASALGQRYGSFWIEQSPLNLNGDAAVLHGWHHFWSDEDFYMPAEMQLLLWTLWDSEPWVELWRRRQNFRLEVRIT